MSDAKRWRWWAAGAGLLVVLAVIPVLRAPSAGASPPASRERLVLNEVHTDSVHVEYAAGALGLRSRSGAPPYQLHEPADVIFQLKDVDSSRLQVPDLAEYAFLGAPGSPVWLAPQTQDPALLFAGWDTEEIPLGALAGDTVALSLVEVEGPGRVEVFENGPTGAPLRIFSSQDRAYRTRQQPVASHVHANWAFSALGRYQLTFEVGAVTSDGTPLAPARASYTWYVGGGTAADVTPEPTATSLSVSPREPRVGEPVTLSASVTPPGAAGWVEFFAGARSLGFTGVTAGRAELTTAELPAGAQSLTAAYTPVYRNDHAESVSPPVSVTVQPGGTTAPPSTPPTGSPSATASPSPTGSPSATGSATPSAGPTATVTPTASRTAGPSTPARTGSPRASATTCVPVTRTSTGTSTTTAKILRDGHADYAVRLAGGRLVSQVKDGTAGGTPVWRDPADVVFHVPPAAGTKVPASGFDFLAPAGSTIWQISQTQQQGIVWLGWNTEEVTAAQVRGPVTWSLDRVDGPGRVAIYLLGAFGQPQVVFNSGDGLPDRYDIPLGTHAHGNWAFTRPGVYRLTLTHRATLASGATVSDTAVVTLAVGDVDPQPLARRTVSTTRTYAGTSCDGRLALTGDSLVGPVTLGGVLVLAGTLAVVGSRIRRRSE